MRVIDETHRATPTDARAVRQYAFVDDLTVICVADTRPQPLPRSRAIQRAFAAHWRVQLASAELAAAQDEVRHWLEIALWAEGLLEESEVPDQPDFDASHLVRVETAPASPTVSPTSPDLLQGPSLIERRLGIELSEASASPALVQRMASLLAEARERLDTLASYTDLLTKVTSMSAPNGADPGRAAVVKAAMKYEAKKRAERGGCRRGSLTRRTGPPTR